MIRSVGDIVEIDGKKYEVTFVNGENYSYKEYLGPKEPGPEKTETVIEEIPRRRTRRK